MKRSSPSAFHKFASFATLALIAVICLVAIPSAADKSKSYTLPTPKTGKATSGLWAKHVPTHFGSLLPVPPPVGATINVNSTSQSPGVSGDCTLGEAIMAANTNLTVDGCSAGSSAADTIMLPAGTYTLTRSDSTHPFYGAVGLPGITSDVVVQGAGSGSTIIERSDGATEQFRLMLLGNGIGSVVLNDLTMRQGKSDKQGGALYTGGRPATFNRVVFNNNQAQTGGAVVTNDQGGAVIANDCIFTNNQAIGGNGGAIVGSPVTISNSTFTGNSAVYGGALFFIQGGAANFNIADSTFTNNHATATGGIGGAIYVAGVATILRSLFNGNSAGSSGSSGGALAGNVCTLNLIDSVVTGNQATSGGGLHLSNSSFNISGSTISNNTASTHFGGGIYANAGGGIISASTINGNISGINGGGIWGADINLTLSNVTVDGNTAVQGGGIYYQDFPGTKAVTLNNVTITGNHATNHGGGLFRASGAITFRNSIFALNTSDINIGPDIYADLILSGGYNLVGIKTGANFSINVGDQSGDLGNPINPLLGPFQNNGGLTSTRVPLTGSPALDGANPNVPGGGGGACEAMDQRGVTRPQDSGSARCDKGAVERTAGKFDFSSATYSVDEDGGTLTVSVSRGIGDFGPVSIGYATSDGTAAAGSDYVATLGTLVFDDPSIAGSSSVQTFTVPILNDTLDELDENFNIVLTNPTGGASLGPTSTAVVTILDNDLPAVSIADVTVDEGNSGTTNAAFNVSLTLPSNQPVTVNYETSDGTATSGSDYQPASGSVVFAPGETNQTINVIIQGDVIREADETFFVNLSGITNGTLARSQGKGTIRNDDFLTDLTLLLFDSPDPVDVGQELTYNINVFSNGNRANGVVLSDTLPANVTFISATPSQGSCTRNDSTVTCNLGNIAQEESGLVAIVVRANVAGTITNSATVTSADPDQNPADNSASVTTTVQSGPPAPPTCYPMPTGLVSWWRFEGSGNDILTNNSALLAGAPSFVPGTVGQSITFDAVDDHARVPASSTLNVGVGNGLTFDAWIYPPEISTARPLIEWSGDPGLGGVHLWMSADFAEGGQGPGSLFVNLVDTTGAFHIFSSSPGVLIANAWQHVALTYDKASGVATIYRNGAKVAEQNLGTFTPQTSTDLYFGYRQAGVLAGRRFLGALDEADLFNRALSQTEIIGILLAGSGGKCIPAVISIAELITVNDEPTLLPSAMIGVDEQIHVADAPTLLPSVMIGVDEQIHVADEPTLLPSAMIGVNENISVHDTPTLLPSAMIGVSENISVHDTPSLLPSVMIGVIEQINVLDILGLVSGPVIASFPTSIGTNVTVGTGAATITFEKVTVAGTTTITPIDLSSTGQLPAGYQLTGTSFAFDITTTAQYSGLITICFSVPSVTDPAIFANLRVLHNENGTLVDRTSSHDFATKMICATVKSLSPFVVAQLVSGPQLLLQATVNDLQALLQTIIDKQDQQKLDEIIKQLVGALDAGNWLDQTHLLPNRGENVFGKIESAILKLAELSKDKKTTIAPAVLQGFMNRLLQCARLLAQTAIIDATSTNGNPEEISAAIEALFQGDMKVAIGNYNLALTDYRDAWRRALKAGA